MSASIQHPDYPLQENVVRARMDLAGYCLQSVGPQETTVLNVTAGSFGGNVPCEMARKTLCIAYPKHLKAMKAALQAFVR